MDSQVTVHPLPIVQIGSDTAFCGSDPITLDAGNPGASYNQRASFPKHLRQLQCHHHRCTASDDINLTFNTPPSIDLGADQQICQGQSLTLDAGGNPGATYLWSTAESSQSIDVNVPGTFSVTVTDGSGCTAMDSIQITVHPLPIVQIGSDTAFCGSDPITLDAGNPGASYNWSSGQASQSISVSSSDNYAVTITDANGCTASDDINLTFNTPPSIDLGADQQICQGQSLTLDAGGNPGATYLWSTAESSQSIDVNVPGTFSVTVTDGSGCTAMDSIQVTVHPLPIVQIGSDTAFCGSDPITLDAGNPGASYNWSSGQASQSISVSSSDNYTVTITDANGCTASDDINLTFNTPPSIDLGADQQICQGQSLTLDAGGNPGATYLWSTAESSQSIDVNVPGTFSVTVTDGSGCTAMDSIQVTVHPLPIVQIGSDTAFCQGGILTLDAGNPGADYLWSTNETTQTIDVSSSGSFAVTVTDANTCQQSDSIEVTVHPLPIVQIGSDTAFCQGGILTLDAENPGADYLWSTNETTQTIDVSSSGSFAVTVTDANTCQQSDSIEVTVHPLPIVQIGSDTAFCQGGILTLDAGNPGADYLWSTNETTQTIDVSSSGSFAVTVTDANTCQQSDSIEVTVHPLPIVQIGSDTAFCQGGILTLDAGNPGADYLWSTNETTQTIDVSSSGSFAVTVTDANTCQQSDSIEVTVHPLPIVQIGSDTAFCQGGILTLDAENPGADYLWSTSETTQTIDVSSSGSFAVTVTDANTCQQSDSIEVTVHPLPIVQIGSDTAFCQGGILTLDAENPGATYLWSTSETTQTIDVSSSGSFAVTVTDANTCQQSDSIEVTVHPLPIVQIGSDTAFCQGGILTLDAENPGADYLWSTNETTQTIDVSSSGSFAVTVTDANTCQQSDSIEVTVHPLPIVQIGSDTAFCQGGILTLDAGNPGANYLWSTNETTQTIDVSSSGSFAVTVTDANTCQQSDSIEVTVHPLPIVQIGSDTAFCQGGILTLDAENPGADYLWSTSETTQTIDVSSSGSFAVTVTDANICQQSDSIEVTVHPLPIVQIGSDTAFCQGGILTLDAENPGADYLWSTNETTQTIDVSSSGSFAVTVTDANTCQQSDSIEVTVHPLPIVQIGSDTAFCQGGILTLDAGNPGANYLWSTNETTQTIDVSSSGSFAVTVTDANTCQQSDSIEITVHPLPIVQIGSDTAFCQGGILTLDAENPGADYLWSTSETTQTIDVSSSGSFAVTVTDANICQQSDSIEVTVLSPSDTTFIDLYSCNNLDSGLVIHHLFNIYGCDSIVSEYTYLLPSDTSYVQLSSCNPADTGLVIYNLTNQVGCDSIVFETTQLLLSDTSYVQLSSCNPVDTGLVIYNFTNQVGCDSIVFETTQLLLSDTSYVQLSSCNPVDTGLVIYNFTNQVGCDSAVFETTQLLLSDTSYVQLSSCNPADTGLVIYNLTNQVGCDSVVFETTQLLLSDTSYVQLSSCNPADTGTVVNTFSNQNGCDSIVFETTQLLLSDTSYIQLSSCNPADTGTVVNTFSNQNGCDSVVFEITQFLLSDTSYIQLSSCNPADTGTVVNTFSNQNCDSVVFETTQLLLSDTSYVQLSSCNPADTGTVVNTFSNQNGCDSVVFETTQLLLSDTSYIQLSSCNPADTGTVVNTFSNQNGCDSVVFEITQFLLSDTSYVQLSSCNPADTGTVVNTFSNQNGCDSIVFETTQFLLSDTSYVQLSSCNPADTGTVVNTFSNQNGCDSVVFETTQFLLSDTSYVQLSSCNPADTGTVVNTFSNQNGCDSVVFEITQFLLSDTSYVQLSSCNPADTGTVVNTFSNQNGCDSLVFEVTQLLPNCQQDTTYLYEYSCEPALAGIDTFTLSSSMNTDSIVIITTSLLPSDTTFINQSSCNPADTGQMMVSLVNQFGCDSLLLIQTDYKDSDTTYLQQRSCNPILVGLDTSYFINQAGCDSLVILETSLLTSDTTFIELNSCHPADTGTVITPLVNQEGCDSLVITHTSLLPIQSNYLFEASCDPLDTGIVIHTFSNQFGCDSLEIISTTLLPTDTNLIVQYTCDSSEVQTVEEILTNRFGCDSLVIYSTQIAPPSVAIFEESTCDPELAGSDTTFLQTVEGCDSLIIYQTVLAQLAVHYNSIDVRCHGDANGLIVIDSVLNESGPYLFALNAAPFSDQAYFNNLPPGAHILHTQSIDGCESSDTIWIQEPPPLSVNIGDDIVLNYGDSVELNFSTSHPIRSWQWHPDGQLSCDSCLSPTVMPQATLDVSILVVDDRGCQAEDWLKIMVQKNRDVYIPNAFSPDGDGINDRFTIYPGPAVKKIKRFEIFDRWGEQVFDLGPTDPSAMQYSGWDGRLKGQPMQPSVFVYVAEIEFTDGSKEILTGDISLIR